MLRNYIKIAWRNLVKHKMYSAIKIGGFAFSIAACMLIGLYITHELNYDRTYPEGDRIYRIIALYKNDGATFKGIAFPAPLGKAIKADFPEVELSGRLMPNALFNGAGSNQVTTEENRQSIYEEGFTYIDQELLDILQLPMVYGTLEHALDKPNTIVITNRKASKFFPNENPIGKIFYLNNNLGKPYTITGVVEDFPLTSHLHNYDFLLTLSGVDFYPGEQNNWNANNYVDYIRLQKDVNPDVFEKKLVSQVRKNYVVPTMRANGVANPEKEAQTMGLSLQPVQDIHLYSAEIYDYKYVPRGDIRFIWLFGGVALFILLIACINFVNLSTAKSANRAKEIGLRKVVGSHRSSLISQFLAESMLYSFLSIILGLLLAWISLPLFNLVSNKALIFPWANIWLFPILISSTFLMGLLSGIYPAFYLSGFKPINVLKGNLTQGAKNPLFRSGLVVFQFTASIILIIGTLIINAQMQYVLNKKIGFDKDQVLIIQGTNTLADKITSFKEELKKLSGVSNVSVGDYMPVRMGGVKRNGNTFNKGDIRIAGEDTPGQFWMVDEDYLSTLGMHLISGRNFSKEMATDTQSVIINETMVKKLGLDDPVGAKITNGTVYNVIGVVQDFNFESLKGSVEPLCLALGSSPAMISVKISGSDMEKSIKSISALWKSFLPNQAIRYSFLDESYANMYLDIKQTGNIFTSFAVLAIFIACLGLFGLAAFSTEQRTKEMGIRKVLGASVNGIVQLLSKDFIKLVVIAFIIATPLAWWGMNKWLEDFAYRIEIQWWMFVIAGMLSMTIALLTVSFQAVKAAVANPADSLRTE